MCKVFDTFEGSVENGMTRLESRSVHDSYVGKKAKPG